MRTRTSTYGYEPKEQLKEAAEKNEIGKLNKYLDECDYNWQIWDKAVEKAVNNYSTDTFKRLVEVESDWKLKAREYFYNHIKHIRSSENIDGFHAIKDAIDEYRTINTDKVKRLIIKNSPRRGQEHFFSLYDDKQQAKQDFKELLNQEYERVPESIIAETSKRNLLDVFDWLENLDINLETNSVRDTIIREFKTGSGYTYSNDSGDYAIDMYYDRYPDMQNETSFSTALEDESKGLLRDLVESGTHPPDEEEFIIVTAGNGWYELFEEVADRMDLQALDDNLLKKIYNYYDSSHMTTNSAGLNNYVLHLVYSGVDISDVSDQYYELALSRDLTGVLIYLYRNDYTPPAKLGEKVADKLWKLGYEPAETAPLKAASTL